MLKKQEMTYKATLDSSCSSKDVPKSMESRTNNESKLEGQKINDTDSSIDSDGISGEELDHIVAHSGQMEKSVSVTQIKVDLNDIESYIRTEVQKVISPFSEVLYSKMSESTYTDSVIIVKSMKQAERQFLQILGTMDSQGFRNTIITLLQSEIYFYKDIYVNKAKSRIQKLTY